VNSYEGGTAISEKDLLSGLRFAGDGEGPSLSTLTTGTGSAGMEKCVKVFWVRRVFSPSSELLTLLFLFAILLILTFLLLIMLLF
jgi:hypothetical protein